ncbi:MAG TPA: hypothetical protein VFT89_06340, partial [Rhizobiaceae bacterium]|nr:hypothetical protein [Rhizobiaceae bacterium]
MLPRLRALLRALNIETIVADAAPADKVTVVKAEKLRAPTMMVGDRINDAPAPPSATVGIAMGAGGDGLERSRRHRGSGGPAAARGIRFSDRTTDTVNRPPEHYRWPGALGAGMVAATFGLIWPVAGASLQEGIDVAVIL